MYLENVTVHGYKAASSMPLECALPGRFAVLAGPNGSGKSTVAESIVLAHRDVFPAIGRPTSAALSRDVDSPTIDVKYALESPDDSPLGELCKGGARAPEWTTELSSSMGRISTSTAERVPEGQHPILYLSPTRNPAADLAGRDARLVVELLRAQALRDRGSKSLTTLQHQLAGLIGAVVSEWPVADAEARVASTLAELTDGVSGHVPYLATTAIDDTFLARVFEFLISVVGAERFDAHRLETEGLGYANLLQLAVILAAIPDLTHLQTAASGDGDANSPDDLPEGDIEVESAESDTSTADERTDAEREAQMKEAAQQRRLEDDAFFAGSFHAVVVLEEPEAHLHPQLQHGLIRYLKEVVGERPEVQVVLTTHSDEIIAASDPEDLVIFRREDGGQPIARTVRSFSLSSKKLAQARRHLDVSRSATLFADRLVLVEGVTDAIVLRSVARVWAGSDRIRRRFVDALTITIVGSRIGRWLPDLLARPGMEISTRLAVLRDSDDKPLPNWAAKRQNTCFQVFLSEPTLEPALVDGNESAIQRVFERMRIEQLPWSDDTGPTAENVRAWFASRGKGRKAEFADLFSALAAEDPSSISVPLHLEQLLDFTWDGFAPDGVLEGDSPPDEPLQSEEPEVSESDDA